jgi:hypothetical protein
MGVFALATLPWIVPVAPLTAQDVYREVAVANGAGLVGSAVFRGEIPEPRRLLVTKDEEVCGFGYLERTEVAVGVDRGLSGVVVVVEGIREGKAWPASQDGHVLDQKDCIFSPHLQVVPKASDVDIVNSDPVLHNVHAYELIDGAGRTLFNLGQPPSEQPIVQSLRPRFYAADSPYWAVTGQDGTFVIDDIPPGDYSIIAWHPSLGGRQQNVSLGPGGAAEIVLDFTDG